MADHNSSNFDAFCDDAYDETEENLILADAMEKGVTFEQAMSGVSLGSETYHQYMSRNAPADVYSSEFTNNNSGYTQYALANPNAGQYDAHQQQFSTHYQHHLQPSFENAHQHHSQYNHSFNPSNHQQQTQEEPQDYDDSGTVFYDPDGNVIGMSQDESDAYAAFEANNNLAAESHISGPNMSMRQMNLGHDSFPPLSGSTTHAPATSAYVAPLPKSKLKLSASVFVPRSVVAPASVPQTPVPQSSASGGRVSYSNPLDNNSLNLTMADCPAFFESQAGCPKSTTCAFRHCIKARINHVTFCQDFAMGHICPRPLTCVARHVIQPAPPSVDSGINGISLDQSSLVRVAAPSNSPSNVPFQEWPEWAEVVEELVDDGKTLNWNQFMEIHKREIEMHKRAKSDFNLFNPAAKAYFDQIDDLRLTKWKALQKAYGKRTGINTSQFKTPGTW